MGAYTGAALLGKWSPNIYVCPLLVSCAQHKQHRKYMEGCSTEFRKNAHFYLRFRPKKVAILVTFFEAV